MHEVVNSGQCVGDAKFSSQHVNNREAAPSGDAILFAWSLSDALFKPLLLLTRKKGLMAAPRMPMHPFNAVGEKAVRPISHCSLRCIKLRADIMRRVLQGNQSNAQKPTYNPGVFLPCKG